MTSRQDDSQACLDSDLGEPIRQANARFGAVHVIGP